MFFLGRPFPLVDSDDGSWAQCESASVGSDIFLFYFIFPPTMAHHIHIHIHIRISASLQSAQPQTSVVDGEGREGWGIRSGMIVV